MKGTSLEDAQPEVDTQKPSLYAYAEKKKNPGQGRPSARLHPVVSRTPEAAQVRPRGRSHGGLDLTHHPGPSQRSRDLRIGFQLRLLLQGLFPQKIWKIEAGDQYKEKLRGKSFYLENKIPGKIDVVLPEVVDQDQDPAARSVIYYTAGKHQFVTVRPATQMSEEDRAAPRETYRLLPYESLEKTAFRRPPGEPVRRKRPREKRPPPGVHPAGAFRPVPRGTPQAARAPR